MLHDTRFRLPDELAVYFQIHLAVGIPLGFETGGTLMENVGSNHGGLAVHAGDKTELSLVEIDAVVGERPPDPVQYYEKNLSQFLIECRS